MNIRGEFHRRGRTATDWAKQLDNGRGSRGSRPRCVLLVVGERNEVAQRLTRLVNLPEVSVSAENWCQPRGRPAHRDGSWDTTPSNEVDLAGPNDLVSPDVQRELQSWWLEAPRGARTPNWDLAATCTIRGRSGLLLVEAKAHAEELGSAGKGLPSTPNGWRNHERIGNAIAEAAAGLSVATSGSWAISRDSHYQLSNRFAWAWKLASLDIPVALVYLGFLNAFEMTDLGQPFGSEDEWKSFLMDHCDGIVDQRSWGEWVDVGDTPMISVVRAYDQPITSTTNDSGTNKGNRDSSSK